MVEAALAVEGAEVGLEVDVEPFDVVGLAFLYGVIYQAFADALALVGLAHGGV